LIGMIRHLHGLGLILLSIDCFDADTGETLSADPL
jgi:hypothetical protein